MFCFMKLQLIVQIVTMLLQGTKTGLNIGDNDDPKKGGTFVTCKMNSGKMNNIFCSGLGDDSIKDAPTINNTDCKTKGVAGKPGAGSCPKV